MIRRRALVALFALLSPAVAARADEAPNHLDVGIVPYMVNTRYGGGKLEGRLNLAPGASDAGLYVSGGIGAGSWSDRIGPFITWFSSDANYAKWKTKQKFAADLGLGVTYKTTHIAAGVMSVAYETTVYKHLNGVDYYTPTPVTGNRVGGWVQVGYEVPLDRWLAGIALGYRETRTPVNVPVVSSTGAVEHVQVRPVRGLFLALSLRFKLL